MLKNIKIENFRGIESLEINDFKRINIFCGKNSCGKTSILEAIYISFKPYSQTILIDLYQARRLPSLATLGAFNSLNQPSASVSIVAPFWENIFSYLKNNSKDSDNTKISTNSDFGINLNREILLKSSFSYKENLKNTESSFKNLLVAENKSSSESNFFYISSNDKSGEKEIFYTTGFAKSSKLSIACEMDYFAFYDEEARKYKANEINYSSFKIFYYSAMIGSFDFIKEHFKIIRDTKIYEKILQFLKEINSEIQEVRFNEMGNLEFVMKNKFGNYSVNPSLLGDGLIKVFGILCALSHCKNGVLIIDEIENGIHFSVQEKFWKLVSEFTKEFNVQIFATTHSQEMIAALSKIINPNDEIEDVKLININKNKIFEYSEKETELSMINNFEIR